MKRTQLLIFILTAAALLFGVTSTEAGIIEVTPTNLNGWGPTDVRNDGFVGITTTQPRSGNGSLEFSSTGSPDKADYTYYSGNVLGDLAAVDTLSYDWYRDSSSTAPGHLNPVFRLIVYDSVAAEYSYLIWEGVYNDYTASNLPTDTWTTEDILGGNFWQWNITQSAGVFEFNHDLSYWVNELNDASVVGLNVGIGSGWADSFLGFADNVTIGFTGADATCWNFESTPVPEPATVLMLSGLGIGLALGRRRKK